MKKQKKLRYVLEYLIALATAIVVYLFFTLIINIEEKYFTRPLSVTMHPDFIVIDDSTPRMVQVMLKGNPALLNKITGDDLIPFVDFSLNNQEGTVGARVVLKHASTLQQFNNVEINIIPQNVSVVLEKKLEKEVYVNPAFVNSLPRGYTLDKSIVDPKMVRVQGPRSLIERLNKIDTTNIDLSRITKDSFFIKSLQSPNPLISILDNNKNIKISVFVAESIVVHTVRLLPKPIGLSSDFEIVSTIPRIKLSVQSSLANWTEYIPEVFFDMSSYKKSKTYTVELIFVEKEGLELLSINPSVISVTLVKKTE